MQKNGCGCELPWAKEKIEVIFLNHLSRDFIID